MASVFVLLEAFNRKEAAALGFFPCATASFFVWQTKQIYFPTRCVPMLTILCLFRVKVNTSNSFTEPPPKQICDAGTGRLLTVSHKCAIIIMD